MSDTIFVDGLIVKPPHKTAMAFVKCKLSFRVAEIVPFLQEHESDGWVNCDVLVSKGDKWYAKLDTWKPKKQAETEPF